MTVQAKGFEGQVLFNFYTYDYVGRDVVIPIFAETQHAAWERFTRVYGKEFPVDMVREASK